MRRLAWTAAVLLAAPLTAGCSSGRDTTSHAAEPSSGAAISAADLRARAATRPMTEETVAVFRRANAEGYFSMSAVLLADNGSPRALALLESMLVDRSVPAARRIDAMHLGVYPHRAEPPMLELSGRLLAGDVEDEVAVGLVEAVFDDEPSHWLDPSTRVKPPPAWDRAPPEAVKIARDLAVQVRARGRLPERLLDAVGRAEELLRRAAAGHGAP